MRFVRRSSQTHRQGLARTYRWVTAWLIAGAVLALLLLANSIRDYLFVWRILAVQQVRHQLSEQVVALEQRLRGSPTPQLSPLEIVTDAVDSATDKPLWMELRRPDGSVLARQGSAVARLFTTEDESAHFRNRQPLYRVVSASVGEVVVEVFPLRSAGLALSSQPVLAESGSSTPRRNLVVVEIAAPLVVRDASVIWPIRRNLAINCSGALALLATVVIASLGFRSYARGRRLELQLEIAREVQSELLPPEMQACEPLRLATVYRPAEQVSGDFYDVFRSGDDRIAMVIGDVSGKGVPAALVMGVIHGALRSSAWSQSTSAHELESARLNLLLCEKGSFSRYSSMFWCYYEPEARRLHYVNAGHHPPLLVGERDERRRDHASRRRRPGARPASGGALRAGLLRRPPGRRARPLLGRLDRGDQPGRRGVRREPVARLPGDGRRPQRGRDPRRDPGVGQRLPRRGAAPGRPDARRREVRVAPRTRPLTLLFNPAAGRAVYDPVNLRRLPCPASRPFTP